uniref:Uncharacterized protein n=1 Tax=viral metagenome TaxID=1070528 RepID=A0A6C0D5T8_9ZZZZ
MTKSRNAMHNKRRAGVKNTTLKAQKKEEALILKEIKAAKAAQKKEEAQILKDVKAQKKEEKARIKEEKARIKEEKARIKALKKTKKAQKAQPKVETSADIAKVEKLALELYKKSSAMKAQAKADLIQMARNTDKESIDIMLEDNFYELTNKQLEVWLAKARAKLNK